MMKKIEILMALTLGVAATAFAGLGTVAVGVTETQVMPAKADRRWVVLQNNSTNDIYIKADSSTNTLTAANGMKVAANGGTFTVMATSAANPARNAIKAISGTGTNNLVFQEGNEN